MHSSLASRLSSLNRDGIASVDENGLITYGNLLDRAAAMAAQIGEDRELVILESEASIRWLIAYVATHLGGHSVLLAPNGATSAIKQFAGNYAATVEVSSVTGYTPHRLKTERPVLNPELNVLLLTSGSTGSPKCVRLSRENIASNAQSIVAYLNLDSTERAVVNLPVNYSYGLSIVNSHLWVGATLLLTESSVIDPNFWEFCRVQNATSFAGVPHTYDLLSRIDFPAVAPDSLRYFTQAGGRLATERALELAEIARARNWRFYIMYGQTEASPRMAYLPPEDMKRHAGSIGIAIPDGRLSVQDEEGRECPPNTEGELVYYGPNVMMGYAMSHHELADEPGPRRLRTGDVAKVTEDGFFYITGRLSRFVKIFGTRIGLDEVEFLCREAGYPVIATGNDEMLLVVSRQADAVVHIAEVLNKALKLPMIAINVRHMDEYPVLATGKIDYAGLKASIGKDIAASVSDKKTVQSIYRNILGKDAVDETLSFAKLNGDSLTFVRVSLELEELFGPLPHDWSEISAANLQACLSQTSMKLEHTQRPSSSVLQNIDTLRAIACLLVVMVHVLGIDQNSGLNISNEAPVRMLFDLADLVRMPLFTALAGVLYAAIPAQVGGISSIVKNRFLTLIVPALVVGAINLFLRIMMGLDDLSSVPQLFFGYLHLWYLYALFEIVVVVAAIDLVFRPSNRSWGAVILGFYLMFLLLPWSPFNLAMNLAPYFVLGVLAYRNSAIIRNRYTIVIVVSLSVVGLVIQGAAFSGHVQTSLWISPLFSGALIVSLLYFTPRLKSVEWIGIYSYAIYLWHPTANAAIREVLQRVGLQSTLELFVLGTIAGVFIPIFMYRLISRGPYPVSIALIGR